MTSIPTARLISLFDPRDKAAKIRELRGEPVFTVLHDIGRLTYQRISLTGEVEIRPGFYLVDCNNLNAQSLVDYARDHLSDRSVKVIVDVHFPLMDIAHVNAFQDVAEDKRDLELDAAARAFWSEEQNQRSGIMMVQNADAVMCPRPEWARSLALLNPNVFVVPDVKDIASAKQFFQMWCLVIERAAGQKSRWTTRLRNRIAAIGVGALMQGYFANGPEEER